MVNYSLLFTNFFYIFYGYNGEKLVFIRAASPHLRLMGISSRDTLYNNLLLVIFRYLLATQANICSFPLDTVRSSQPHISRVFWRYLAVSSRTERVPVRRRARWWIANQNQKRRVRPEYRLGWWSVPPSRTPVPSPPTRRDWTCPECTTRPRRTWTRSPACPTAVWSTVKNYSCSAARGLTKVQIIVILSIAVIRLWKRFRTFGQKYHPGFKANVFFLIQTRYRLQYFLYRTVHFFHR